MVGGSGKWAGLEHLAQGAREGRERRECIWALSQTAKGPAELEGNANRHKGEGEGGVTPSS